MNTWSESVSKMAFITGGSRGLGFEVARGLARTGISSVLIAKDAQRLEASAQQLRAEFPGITFETSACDLEDQVQTRNAAESLLSTYGAPYALVLAHGVMSEKMSKTLRTTDAEWRRVMAINLDSVFTLVNVLGGPMADARDGRRVVVFSACLGRMSGPGNAGGLAPYRISKAGVNAFVRNLAHETGLGARGFYVDAICPNHSRTDMGGADAPRSAEEGAECAVWLANREFNDGDTTGVLWEDRQIVQW
ncbi:unannotated protein [freshwater metagenome]|jgi:NAD(P)-dependent dehydrogenase (short-subunit alcohol dehydrogenase family)|uniref:Unannotated protein n=1 Tax=freshwater metagenome TaxID=449393 RepID=A0A6J7H7X7_9ZZZZ|nr:SDR family NAD(P)-dependent oxidoreductase [Actinomycetota bacterium]